MTQTLDTPSEAGVAILPVDKKPPLQHVKFARSDIFLKELKKKVDAYFKETGQKPRDCPRMYLKTATIMLWFTATYVALVFFATSPWLIVALAAVMGLAMAAIGFNIQHDGGHRAYSDRPWVNRLMAMSLDLIGGSSYMWDWKHNSIHHTYPNVTGHDDDIEVGFLGRLSPHQKRYPFHRFQNIYLWVLYGLLAVKWHLYDDFYNVAIGRIGEHKIPRPRGMDLVGFIAGKFVFFSWAFFIPMFFHPIWGVICVYLLSAFISGVVLSVVFQLAHVVEEANFPMPDENGKMATDWAVHQVQTTVDFSRGSKVLCWFLGGLNFQVEHHLFHKICHIHYPALSKLVEKTCEECGIRYAANTTFMDGVRSHYRWLHRMGQPTM